MITISLCMIVKNEEKTLSRCLDCVADLMDEIIIVDTGSTDSTKSIAKKYTDKIYDFKWNGSFADARNFSFSKATCQYIYSADADEVIDQENHDKFALLKKGLLPEIDIVQMLYCNQMEYNTVYNYDRELRPKLYKRLRNFVWQNPIHEAVRLQPVIYDSEIEIIHKPTGFHASRDLLAFEKMHADGLYMDTRLHTLYAKELLISGEKSNLLRAIPFFEGSVQDEKRSLDSRLEAYCVLARAYHLKPDIPKFFKYALRAVTLDTEGCAEICLELAVYFHNIKDYGEEQIWLNAALSSPCILNKETTEIAKKMLE
ncbi:MAG: glycosyltransferase family 2 protein [Lachnospiraceae bacterium]|nr:glycosyltransferase family 2 protein [Lachnospiraceae bacterium]